MRNARRLSESHIVTTDLSVNPLKSAFTKKDHFLSIVVTLGFGAKGEEQSHAAALGLGRWHTVCPHVSASHLTD